MPALEQQVGVEALAPDVARGPGRIRLRSGGASAVGAALVVQGPEPPAAWRRAGSRNTVLVFLVVAEAEIVIRRDLLAATGVTTFGNAGVADVGMELS